MADPYTIYKGFKFDNEKNITPSVFSFSNKRSVGTYVASCSITTQYNVKDNSVPPQDIPINIFDSIRIVNSNNVVRFKGLVTDITIRDNKKIIVAEDVLTVTKWREYHENTEPKSQDIKTLFTTLINTAFTGYFGVNVETHSSTPNPSTVTWKFDHANIFERLQRLAYAVGWIFYYEPSNNTVYFKPKASDTNPKDFNINQNNVSYPDNMYSPSWSSTGKDIINKTTLVGGQSDGTDIYPRYSSYDYEGKYYEEAPANTFIFPYYNDLPNYPDGLTEGDNGLYYWNAGTTVTKFTLGVDYTVQSNGKRILIRNTSPAYVYNRLLRLKYNVTSSPVATAENSASQNSYGIRDRTTYRTDIKLLNDLQPIADNMAGATGLLTNPYDECSFSISLDTIATLGQSANVRDGIHGITKTASANGTYISEIVENYPEGLQTISVTNRPLKDFTTATQLEDRIKRLEEDATQSKDKKVGGSGDGNFTTDVTINKTNPTLILNSIDATSSLINFKKSDIIKGQIYNGGANQNDMVVISQLGNLYLSTATSTGGNIYLETKGITRLTVSDTYIQLGSNPLRFTSQWSSFPDNSTAAAEISNDTNNYKTLMIVGNKSAGLGRRVSVWDRLEVNGNLKVTGTVEDLTLNNDPTTTLRFNTAGVQKGYINSNSTGLYMSCTSGKLQLSSSTGDIEFRISSGKGIYIVRS